MANLFSSSAPYVHSNFSRFDMYYRNLGASTETDEGRLSLTKAFDDRIRMLERFSRMLKTAAEEIMGGADYKTFSRYLFFDPESYRGIAFKILEEPKVQRSLINKVQKISQESLDKVDHKGLHLYYATVADEEVEEIPIQMVTDGIISMLGKGFFSRTKSQQVRKLRSLGISTDRIKRRLQSSTGVIRKIVREDIQNSLAGEEPDAEQTFQNFWRSFESEFKTRTSLLLTSKSQTSINGMAPQDYLDEVKPKLKAAYEGGFKQLSQVTAAFGEPTVQILTKADGLDIITEVVGGKSQNDLYDEITKTLGDVVQRTKLRDPTKSGITDLVLKHNGKTVRVQSKNYQHLVKIADTDAFRDASFAILKNVTHEKFIEKLKETSALSGTGEEISYIIANMLWLNEKGSRNYSRMNRSRRETSLVPMASLRGMEDSISQLVGQISMEVFGIQLAKLNDAMELTILPEYSNVFYLVGNRTLYPTYLIIDDYIKLMRSTKEESKSRFKFTMQRTGIKYAYTSASQFYEEKRKASLGGLDASKYYTDPGLVQIGTEQGKSILGSLTYKRISATMDYRVFNLNINSSFSG